jgi:hypothetical protein
MYKLGFGTNHVKMEGVKIFREEEVIKSLTSQGRGGNAAKNSGFAEASSKPTIDSCVDEISLSRLDRKRRGRIAGEDLSQKRKCHESTRNRSQHTTNAASIDN